MNLESSIIELQSSVIPTFFVHLVVLFAILKSSLIELESSLIQLQITANELERSLIVHI